MSIFRFDQYLKSNRTLVIAELANAFEGKKDVALKMIDAAEGAGVDALKFQIFFADELLVPEHPKYGLFKRLETGKDDWRSILEYAASSSRLVFLDVFGEESYQFSRSFKVDAYKIPPSDMTNHELIRLVSLSGKSVILSSGAAAVEEMEKAVSICRDNGLKDLAIMHGFQAYPTKIEDTGLNRIEALSRRFGCPAGYADHVDGGSDMALIMPLLAIAKGARLIEKHFTLNRDLKGIDYESSINPPLLKTLVKYIRELDVIYGKSYLPDQSFTWELSSDEKFYKQDVRKRLVARRNLKAGEKISREDIALKRAPAGIFSEQIESVLGRELIRDVNANKTLESSHFA